MTCEECMSQHTELYSVPLHKPTGELCALVCRACAERLSLLCREHDTIHEGFADGTHACLACIEDDVCKYQHSAAPIYQRLKTTLPPTALDDLVTRARMSRTITGDTTDRAILRFIITKQHRSNQTISQIVYTMIETESVQLVLT